MGRRPDLASRATGAFRSVAAYSFSMAPAFRNTAPVCGDGASVPAAPWGRSPIAKSRPRPRSGPAYGPGARGRSCISPKSGSRPTHETRTDSGRGHVSGKMAARATLLRQARAAGFTLTAVVGDAEFGDVYGRSHGLASPAAAICARDFVDLTVFLQRPLFATPSAAAPRPPLDPRPSRVRSDRSRCAPSRASCRGGHDAGSPGAMAPTSRRARFAAVRVTPAHGWRHGPLAPVVWLLCEREEGRTGRRRFYFVHLPADRSWRVLVRLAHQRWAIEQQYQELKSELGLDHFEGRTYPGWQHHVVLTAVSHAYIQRERMRRGAAGLTFPAVRAIVQEIFTALLFAAKPRYMHWMEEAKRELQLRI